MKKDKIIITVQGGLVTGVYSTNNNIEVEILDHDIICNADDEIINTYNEQNNRIQNEIQNMIEVY